MPKIHRLCAVIAGYTDRRRERLKQSEPSPARYLGYGLTWALSTLLFLYLGTLLDGWLGSEPVLTVVGAFVGAAAGFYYMYYNLVTVTKQQKSDRSERKE